MEFEYDSVKSAANKSKHGIDFEEAQQLWADPDLVEIPARALSEPRWVVIARHNGLHWSAVITRRGENIRLISVRRARAAEVELHEAQKTPTANGR